MKELKYQIRTLDPIIISSEPGNQFMVPTKDYIPGGAILGTLAGIYLKQKKEADQIFYELFVNGKVNYSNAYKTDKFGGKEVSTFPLPFSIQHVKNNDEAIFDLLYSETNEQTKAVNGYGSIENDKLNKTIVLKSTNPHHERNYETGSAEPGVFFNYESINPNQNFEGTIWGEDTSIDQFHALFSSLTSARIGRSRNTEYGKVQLLFYKPEDIKRNEIKLNQDDTVSLTFLSNVILYNENGASTSKFSDLELCLKDKISPNIEIKKVFLRTEEIENYVSVWKLKRPSEISFQAGSCLLLKVDRHDIDKLKMLQLDGIGERRHEGFGQVAFGLQLNLIELKKNTADKVEPTKPESAAPELLKEKTIKLAGEFFKKITAVAALSIVDTNKENLRKKITSSQIGRLEGICRISSSEDSFPKREEKFINEIKRLRETSKKKLTSCDFYNSNLFDFLTSKNILNNSKIVAEIEIIKKLFTDVGIDLSEINSIQRTLFEYYYLTLFSAMRKAIKGGK